MLSEDARLVATHCLPPVTPDGYTHIIGVGEDNTNSFLHRRGINLSTCKYLFKYLPVNYAEDLFYKGKIHFKNAAYFCSIEEDGIRGDKHDGSEIFSNTITIKNSSGEQVVPGKAFTVRSQEELKTTYIFCHGVIIRLDFATN